MHARRAWTGVAWGLAAAVCACAPSGTDVEGPRGPGPWPTDAVKDYSAAYGLGPGVQSVGVDEGHTLWLLRGEEIGVLRPGDARPTWTRGVGQAAGGFGKRARAMGSTVICGGEAGRAYVGYWTYDLAPAFIAGPSDEGYDAGRFEEYQKGDVDAVRVQEDGTVVLEEHLWRSAGVSGGDWQLGLRNTNDYHYDEDRSVFSCQRVMRGPGRGDVYLGTNHGVTLVRGLTFNSHRHPTWYGPGQTLMAGYTHGLGVGRDGDVLIANDWMVGVLPRAERLEDFDEELTFEGPVPWKFKGHNAALNPLEDFDFWRAMAQTDAETYWLGSRDFGLWRMERQGREAARFTRLSALPSSGVLALAATEEGALYVGTDSAGLWRLEKDGTTLSRVEEVTGGRVLQLLYDASVSPTALYVLTDTGLTVLRGR